MRRIRSRTAHIFRRVWVTSWDDVGFDSTITPDSITRPYTLS